MGCFAIMSYIAELKTKNTLIVGGGTTGKSLANYLSSLGASFTVFDEKATTHNGLDATTEIDDYSIYDLAIVSPGWRQDHLVIANLQSAGVEILSEIDFASLLQPEYPELLAAMLEPPSLMP